ncbi:MAG: dephospho-CoA kinase [Nitrospirae bacterium]|nr:dephospho-CoA kinase [Nitrospirota bacterium]
MLLVALTGNYGMGKSTVLSMFRNLGASTIDTDRVVDSLLTEKRVLIKIKKLLGNEVFYKDGSLNKKKVAKLIFKDNNLRRSLEDILHPLVFERIKDFTDKITKDEKIIIVAVPLVYERGYENRFDKIVVVHTDLEVAINRLENSGIAKKDALLRLKAQLPIEEKMKRADFLIDNNGSLLETVKQVKKIFKKLTK